MVLAAQLFLTGLDLYVSWGYDQCPCLDTEWTSYWTLRDWFTTVAQATFVSVVCMVVGLILRLLYLIELTTLCKWGVTTALLILIRIAAWGLAHAVVYVSVVVPHCSGFVFFYSTVILVTHGTLAYNLIRGCLR